VVLLDLDELDLVLECEVDDLCGYCISMLDRSWMERPSYGFVDDAVELDELDLVVECEVDDLDSQVISKLTDALLADRLTYDFVDDAVELELDLDLVDVVLGVVADLGVVELHTSSASGPTALAKTPRAQLGQPLALQRQGWKAAVWK